MNDEEVMKRFYHMMTESGAVPASATNDDLMKLLKGNTPEEKMHSARQIVAVTEPDYWIKVCEILTNHNQGQPSKEN